MGKLKTFIAILFGSWMILLSGCYNDITDPTQIGRFEPTPKVNVILDSLGVADEPSPTYEGAEDPKPADLIDPGSDYVFGSGDVVRISIFELYVPNQVYVNDYIVTETGRISIPDVGQVQAAGLTEAQLEQEIRDILSPSIIKSPSVTAILLSSQSRYFSIVGQGVGQSARFEIPRNTFRLTDAIALAGGISEFNVSYIYVKRDVPQTQTASEAAQNEEPVSKPKGNNFDLKTIEPTKQPGAEEEMLEIITPAVVNRQSSILITSAEMATPEELESLAAPEGITVEQNAPTEPVTEPLPQLPTQPQSEQIQWVFEDGKWKPVRAGGQVQAEPSPTLPVSQQQTRPLQEQIYQRPETATQGFGLEALGTRGKVTRVIQIPRDKLSAGDPRYDIVIQPGDRIMVPVDIIGEFWMMGNVNSQGAIPITGRPITLKMAIASAGGLNAIAAPQKVEVVRRIGKNKAGLMREETVLVDLDKISKGLQPDFFIKPYDLINVGTNGTSRWLAVLRNAFRATYGFAFVYDRNFADLDVDPWPGAFHSDSIF